MLVHSQSYLAACEPRLDWTCLLGPGSWLYQLRGHPAKIKAGELSQSPIKSIDTVTLRNAQTLVEVTSGFQSVITLTWLSPPVDRRIQLSNPSRLLFHLHHYGGKDEHSFRTLKMQEAREMAQSVSPALPAEFDAQNPL